MLVVGCSSTPPMQAGASGLRVWIVAQPKAGFAYDNTYGSDAYYGGASSNAASTGKFALVDYRKLHGVVIWAKPVAGESGAAPDAVVEVTGAPDERSGPIIATGPGGRIVVHNTTGEAHDIYGLHDTQDAGFDIGAIAAGETGEATVTVPGIYEVLSDSYDEPIARLFVAPSGYVAVGRSGRNVTFMDLPPGKYQVACWHRRLPGSQRTVELAPDQLQTVSLKVTVNALAASR